MVITWRILCLCFMLGSFRCPRYGVDSRVRHAYFCASICAKIRAAHSNMSDKVGNVPLFYSVREVAQRRCAVKRNIEIRDGKENSSGEAEC